MAEGAAKIASLNAFSAWPGHGPPDALGFSLPKDALKGLAKSAANDPVEQGILGMPRIVVLDALVKLAAREKLRPELNGEIERLLAEVARRAGVPEGEISRAALIARDALDSAALVARSGQGDPWQAFADDAAEPLRLTRSEIEKPRCNDTGNVQKAGNAARGVTVEFYTDTSPGAMRDFCDPTKWHDLSAYQSGMERIEAPGAVHQTSADGLRWRDDYTETVELSPATKLKTPLRFSYAIDSLIDPRWVHLDYVLLDKSIDPATAKITVDEGSLDLRLVTEGSQRGRTRVSAKKAIFFRDLVLQEWTSIACDTFWTDTVVAAAVSAGNGGM